MLLCDVTVDVESCESNPCQNKGLCRDVKTGVACVCVGGFFGDRCQQTPFVQPGNAWFSRNA